MLIPVTILTGFLGAGKTTLLNNILKQNEKTKIQIVENEFGSENIDGGLIEPGNDIMEISDGCICCTSSDEFSSAMFSMLEFKEKPEHLIIETTGIANPETLIRQFLADYQLASAFRLNAVIALADAVHLDGLIHQRPEVEPQLRSANIIALSKCDIADAYQLETTRNICKRLNPEATIIELRNGTPDQEILWLKQKAYSESSILQYIQASAEETKTSQWHGSLKKMVFKSDKPLDFLKIDTWIKTILRFPDFKIYRLKGYLYFEDLPDKIIVQSVQEIYQTNSGGPWKEGEQKQSILVVIGEGIDEEKLQKTFELCDFTAEYMDFSDYCEKLYSLLSE